MNKQPYKIAILAMGGEGGGVLADWIVQLGEANGYVAQTTSVPGVAQRTGATIYYVELFERKLIISNSKDKEILPVLSLMPMPGDVDIVLASELMEAGRAIVRGLVSQNRTTLITSTHRVYAMSEKSHLGDGRVDRSQLLEESAKVAKRFIGFDMARVAHDSQSVISAVLFGALAASGTLPFSRAQFEETIRAGGVGVEKSLLAFSNAFDQAQAPNLNEKIKSEDSKTASAYLPTQVILHPKIKSLIERIEQAFPLDCQEILMHGVRRLVDYQDPDYAHHFLDRLNALKSSFTDATYEAELIRESARHLALWMSYEDTARVADLKIRASRFERVGQESQLQDGQMIHIHEYMHPRVQEIAETLPAILGKIILGSSTISKLIGLFTSKGRVIKTSTISGFLLLSCVAGAKKWRRTTLRFKAEQERIDKWLSMTQTFAPSHPEKALEWIKCQTLVKGYSDTHERGVNNFERIYAFVKAKSKLSAADIKSIREGALVDEKGVALERVIKQLSY
jgi:indolepyruvate ferredoxin oxidoreductase, beta subunit